MLRRKYGRCGWLSLVLICFPLVIPTAQSTEEAILRALVEQYFSAYVREDLAALGQLWGASAFAARQKELEKLFADYDRIEVRALTVRQFQAEGERARLRVALESSAVNAKTGKPANGFGKQNRSFHFVKENNVWKLQQEEATEEELANLFMAAKTTEARQQVLQAEREFLTETLIRAWQEQATMLRRIGKIPEARARLDLANVVADFAELKKVKAELAIEVGLIYLMQGQFENALPYLTDALRQSEASGDLRVQGMALSRLGIGYQNQGRYDEAFAYVRRSLQIAETLADKAMIARENATLGFIYLNKNNYVEAAAASAKSQLLAAELGDKFLLLSGLQIDANIHDRQYNLPLALDALQKLAQLSGELGSQAGKRFALMQISALYAQQGDYEQAWAKMQEAQQLAAQPNKLAAGVETWQTAYLHYKRGEPARALEVAQRAFEQFEALSAEGLMADALALMGGIQTEQGQYQTGLETSRRAVAIARRLGDSDELVSAGYTMARALIGLQDFAGAQAALTTAIDQTERNRWLLVGNEQTRQRYFEGVIDAYYELIGLHARNQQVAAAFALAERSKSRVLLDVIKGSRNPDKSLSAAEKQEENQLRTEAVRLTQRLRGTPFSGLPAAQKTELENQLQQARRAYEVLQAKLHAAHPEWRAQRGDAPIIIAEELATFVDNKTALLEFVVAREATHLFVITPANNQGKADVRLYTLPVKREELAKQVSAFRQQLAAVDLTFRPAAKQLYDLLLKPAQAQLAGKTKLVIVPDTTLWELPFQALLAPDNRYLIETAAVSYAPSLTVLREMQAQRQRRANATGELLAFGNPSFSTETIKRATLARRDEKLVPLPEAEAEVKALGQLYGARSKVFINAEAREDRWKTEAANAGILHIATHGILNNAAPMYSHLALATNDEKEDGLLEAWELLQMNLKADLAVLSACETARGRIGAGEGVIGLSWALFVAGVPSTVVSQWKVESSSTRDLMLGFHRSLKETNGKPSAPKAEALRQAVLPLLKKPATNHPFYWAGFVLVGDGQ